MSVWSKIFNESPTDKALKDAMRMHWRLIDDEAYQNDILPAAVGDLIKRGSAVDKIPYGSGEFGLDKGNPIPVNGALGELSYLSRMETPTGESLLFHRIGAIGMIDVFEAVTISGSAWHVFYLDCYHPRRSRLAPDGFRLGEPRQFSGFHTYCANFPHDFVKCKKSTPDALRMGYVAVSSVESALREKFFERPMAHRAKLAIVGVIVGGMITSRHL